MSLKSVLWLFSVVILSIGPNAFAQQPEATSKTTGPGIEHRRRTPRTARMRHRRLLQRRAGFGLSETQRQELRAIHESQFESLKNQRAELNQLREKRRAGTFTTEDSARAKALRQEIREARQNTRAHVEGILTAEQRAQIEEMRKARQTQREEMRRRRQERRNDNPL